MKKCLLVSTALMMLAGSAMAADMAVKAPIAAPLPACAQFGGFYLGGNVGWKYRNHEWTDKDGYGQVANWNFVSGTVPAHASESANSWEVGVQSGYNWQFHCTVFGIQGDWNWTDAKVSNFYTAPDNASAFFAGGTNPATLAYSSKEKWFGTLRTRSGVVFDNLLLYVTGGLAWANFTHNHVYNLSNPDGSITGAPFSFSQAFSSSDTKLGFAIGAGTEWALSPNWSIQSEFLYMGFEKDNKSYACVPGATCAFLNINRGFTIGSPGPYRYEYRDNEWVARIGVNYRWGGAPVLARY